MTNNNTPFSSNGSSEMTAATMPLLPRPAIERPRDSQDQPDVSNHVYGPSLPDPVPISEAELNRELGLIRVRDPHGAHAIATLYSDKLIPAIRMVSQVRQEEARLLPERIILSQKVNAAIDEKQRDLKEEQETALQPFRDDLMKGQEELDTACVAARTAFAPLLISYDSEALYEVLFPEPKPRTKEAFAGELGLAWPLPATVSKPVKWTEWGLTLVVGSVLGIASLVAFHIARADVLHDRPGLCFVAALVGTGLIEAVKRPISLLWHATGQLSIIGPSRRYYSSWAGALLLCALFVSIDASVLYNGLIAQVLAHELLDQLGNRGHAGNVTISFMGNVMYWAAAFFITPGLLALAAVEGNFRGRHDATGNLLTAYQEANLQARKASNMTDPQMQAAHQAHSTVQDKAKRKAKLTADMTSAKAPYDTRWKQLEESRMPSERKLRQQSEQFIQDRQHDAFGVLEAFELLLEKARVNCLPPKSR